MLWVTAFSLREFKTLEPTISNLSLANQSHSRSHSCSRTDTPSSCLIVKIVSTSKSPCPLDRPAFIFQMTQVNLMMTKHSGNLTRGLVLDTSGSRLMIHTSPLEPCTMLPCGISLVLSSQHQPVSNLSRLGLSTRFQMEFLRSSSTTLTANLSSSSFSTSHVPGPPRLWLPSTSRLSPMTSTHPFTFTELS